MITLEAVALAVSAFAIAVAALAIWLAFQQRKEAQQVQQKIRDLLSSIEKIMDKTDMQASANFQNLLQRFTDQQNKLVESLSPKPTSQERMSDLFVKLADDPDKLEKVANAIAKVTGTNPLTGNAAEFPSGFSQRAQ